MFRGAARAIQILAVVDDAECRHLLEGLQRPQTATATRSRRREIRFAATSDEALTLLRGPRPDLILLRLSVGGRELLTTIKTDAELHRVPVIVLGDDGAVAGSDLDDLYGASANCFVPLPADPEARRVALDHLEAFWLSLAQLPTEPRRLL